MSFDKDQFRELIVDTLKLLEPEIPFSNKAVDLLMLTAAVESDFGTYLKQKDNGPAVGVFQIEHATLTDIFNNYLVYRSDLLFKLNRLFYRDLPSNFFIGDLISQIVWARLHYYRVPKAIPDAEYIKDKHGNWKLTYSGLSQLASYWKQYYNTALGKGDVQTAIQKYEKYCV